MAPYLTKNNGNAKQLSYHGNITVQDTQTGCKYVGIYLNKHI